MTRPEVRLSEHLERVLRLPLRAAPWSEVASLNGALWRVELGGRQLVLKVYDGDFENDCFLFDTLAGTVGGRRWSRR